MAEPHARPLATPRATVLASLLCGAAAGAAVTVASPLLAPDPAPPPRAEAPAPAPVPAPEAPVDAVPGASLDALREQLATAEAERSQLAGSLLALNRRAEALEARVTELASAAPPAAPDEPDVTGEANLPTGGEGEAIVSGVPGAEGGADAESEELDSLIAAGLDPQSAEEIRRRRDAFQLARLDLVDQAAREGWEGSERFDERLAELEAGRPDLRGELGDEFYDRYLFEEGRSNRVGIASVIAGSAASDAGLVSGDIVLSYAGERVFRPGDLQSATRAGSRGEFVQLSVLRDGDVVAVALPRGPLGVTLSGERRPPG